MPSCLCKKFEGAVFPLPVKTMKDGKNDAVHAFNIDSAAESVRDLFSLPTSPRKRR
jgi:hypothetical protein